MGAGAERPALSLKHDAALHDGFEGNLLEVLCGGHLDWQFREFGVWRFKGFTGFGVWVYVGGLGNWGI